MKVDVWLFGRKSNNKQVNSLCSSHDRSNSFISYHVDMFLLAVSLRSVWGQRRLSGTSHQRGGGFSPLPVGSQQGAFPPLSPSFIIKQWTAPNKVFLLKRFVKTFICAFPAFSFIYAFYFSPLIFLLFSSLPSPPLTSSQSQTKVKCRHTCLWRTEASGCYIICSVSYHFSHFPYLGFRSESQLRWCCRVSDAI